MSPSKRLRPVHELAVNSEEAAGNALQQCRRDLETQLAQLDQLHQYQAEYHRRFGEDRTLTPPQLREFHGFLGRLQEAIDQQGRLVETLRDRCGEQEMQWKLAHTRTQALDKAIDRHETREMREVERREQKINDEFASRRRLAH